MAREEDTLNGSNIILYLCVLVISQYYRILLSRLCFRVIREEVIIHLAFFHRSGHYTCFVTDMEFCYFSNPYNSDNVRASFTVQFTRVICTR